MMTIFTVLLTLLLVLDCVLLILLVLIQLPKKEAGAGLAFGGAATDALFGAGTGNVLTKVTKYATGIFFAIAILLAVIQRNSSGGGSELQRQMEKQASQPIAAPVEGSPAPATPGTPVVTPPASNAPTIPLPTGTNVNIQLPAPSDTTTPPKK